MMLESFILQIQQFSLTENIDYINDNNYFLFIKFMGGGEGVCNWMLKMLTTMEKLFYFSCQNAEHFLKLDKCHFSQDS
jgi:hypothetical protein